MDDKTLAEANREMDAKVAELFSLQEAAELKRRELAEANEKLEKKQAEFMEILKSSGKNSHACALGTVYVTTKWRWMVPKSREDKIKFFNEMKKLDGEETMWQYVTVNSNSLQPWVSGKKEAAEAEGRGMEFAIPGLAPPTAHEFVGMRRKPN